MSDQYKVPATTGIFEFKEKGSRFIGEVLPVESEKEAERQISDVQKREHSATHHCSAFRIGPGVDLERSNDDGEPSGTAGAPILRQIESRGLTNILVVVTRYYGGTKLGTGGLIRAYGAAASGVLDATPVRTETLRDRLQVNFDYADTSPAMHTIEQFEGIVVESNYTDSTSLMVDIARSRSEAFREAFKNALSGRGRIADG